MTPIITIYCQEKISPNGILVKTGDYTVQVSASVRVSWHTYDRKIFRVVGVGCTSELYDAAFYAKEYLKYFHNGDIYKFGTAYVYKSSK